LLSPQVNDTLSSDAFARLGLLLDPDFSPLFDACAGQQPDAVAELVARIFGAFSPSKEGAIDLLGRLRDSYPGNQGVRMVLDLAEQHGAMNSAWEALRDGVDAFSTQEVADHILRSRSLAGISTSAMLIESTFQRSSAPEDKEVIASEVVHLASRAGSEFWRLSREEDQDDLTWRRYRSALKLQALLDPGSLQLDQVEPLAAHADRVVRAQAAWILKALVKSGDHRNDALDRLRSLAFDPDAFVAFEAIDKICDVDPAWQATLQSVAELHPKASVKSRAADRLGSAGSQDRSK
jgi:hypothetical protein